MHLAPIEAGSQLIKLPKAEFVLRCLKTEGVNAEQGRAFYDKLWRLHVDSRSTKKEGEMSKDTVSAGSKEPFKNRLRPGMIVQLTKTHPGYPIRRVAILCPEGAFGGNNEEKEGDSRRYICTEVSPSVMADAYTLAIEHQCVVSLDEMEKEVLMEFDGATRYYFINI